MQMQLETSHVQPMVYGAGAMPFDTESFLDDIQLVRVPADEVASVMELRNEIDLSAHAAAGPQFQILEKKETSAGLWSHSTFTENVSARYASCPWATA